MEKVSVIVPTYNQSQYLPICLDSIWFQDYPNLEIILVNDGSSDNTRDVIGELLGDLRDDIVSYASHYNEEREEVERAFLPRYQRDGRKLVIIHHEKNKGLGATLNTGFRACTGTYCTFIASDDMLLPDMVSECVRAIETHGTDFVYADMHVVDDRGRILRKFALPDYSFEDCFCHWYLCGICKLYRSELHVKWGYYREDLFAHDHELFLRFASQNVRFYHLPQVLANVRYHGKDREVSNHSAENWNRLYEQSKALVLQARALKWMIS